MKAFVGIILLAAVAFAEPPRNQPQRQYYFAKQEEAAEAPYPPSSWRPNGPAFNLPQRVQNVPQRQYGAPVAAPQQQYGAPVATPQQKYGFPEQKYGAPESTTEIPYDLTDNEESTTLSSDSESVPVKRVNELADEDLDESQPKESGEYYIALPDGRLQRVQYVSSQNVEAMKYFAKIRAENVEPLRGPIYAYAPLPKLQILPGGLQLSVAPGTPVTAAAVASVTVEESKPERILGSVSPAKLEIQPVTQVQYQYDNPAAVVPLSKSGPAAPLSSSYTTYTANYQVPAGETRYILAL